VGLPVTFSVFAWIHHYSRCMSFPEWENYLYTISF